MNQIKAIKNIRNNIYLTGNAQSVRGNRLKLRKETFKSKIRDNFG